MLRHIFIFVQRMRLRYRISFQRSDDRPDESTHGFQAPTERNRLPLEKTRHLLAPCFGCPIIAVSSLSGEPCPTAKTAKTTKKSLFSWDSPKQGSPCTKNGSRGPLRSLGAGIRPRVGRYTGPDLDPVFRAFRPFRSPRQKEGGNRVF